MALLAVPLVYSIVWSFQSVQYGMPGEWIGLDNYTRVLTDQTFHTAVIFTVGFALVHTGVVMALGYGLALLLHRARRGKSMFLGILLTPYVIPAVIGATAFSWLFDDSFGGLVNVAIDSVTGQTVQWFTSTWPNRTLVLMAATWASLPFMMLVFLGALKGIPGEQLEAATIDGANWWQRQWYVVIPMLGPMFRFLALTSIMGGLGLFDALIPLAPNAQAVGTQSVNLYVFQNAFARDQQNLGLGSAVNILMLLVMFTLIAPFVRQVYREVKEGS
ncbi:carbohydrate ABC transporter permease [Nocardioides albus]|uniref:ABC-type sugar transport system permease subunit n=1 Tax=Nocardioides albus TaxID=1841 RepID=A0A7W5A2T5_9ACTN|nr:sugar ABC transporter permease [Nocardioides albus]MBB3088637.1 ABC-type sugar transport system permease subunit [Nocardioides albus]